MRKTLSYIVLMLASFQVLLILVSWFITAAMPELYMRSMLSSEGVRWFFGHFTDNISSPLLTWLLVGSLAYGSVISSGITKLKKPLDFRDRFALRLVAFEVVIFVVVILLLTVVPHAILLSVSGNLFPSSFSYSIIPYIAFAVSCGAVTFSLASGRVHSVCDIFDMFTLGIKKAAPIFFIYIIAAQLYQSVLYVFWF
jgi:p-aminobenzoyl-glutamate transporter AbgT